MTWWTEDASPIPKHGKGRFAPKPRPAQGDDPTCPCRGGCCEAPDIDREPEHWCEDEHCQCDEYEPPECLTCGEVCRCTLPTEVPPMKQAEKRIQEGAPIRMRETSPMRMPSMSMRKR